MNSEHQIIFSSISCQRKDVKNILEIGTYDAKNAFLLSKLFPKAKILTLDLPNRNKNFKNTYGRKKINELSNFIEERDHLLKNCKNVSFKIKFNQLIIENQNLI